MTLGLDENQANPHTTVNQMVNGWGQKAVTGGSYGLSDYEATWAILEVTGTLSSNASIVFPPASNKVVIYNNTAGAYALEVRASASGGVGVTISQGAFQYVYSDATDYYSLGNVFLPIAGGTLTGALTVNASGITITSGALEVDPCSLTANASGLSLASGIFEVAACGLTANVSGVAIASGDLIMGDNAVRRPELRDYSETAVSIIASTINMELGNYQYKTIVASVAFDITNPSPDGTACRLRLELTNASTLVSFNTLVKWPGGTQPTLSGSGTDILDLVTHNASSWFGELIMSNLS